MASQFQYDSKAAENLAQIISVALNVPEEQLQDYLKKRRDADRRALRRHEARWAKCVNAMTDVQAALVISAEAKGYEVNKFYTDRRTGHSAPMMVKKSVWNSAKGRMGKKLLIVYPDGSQTTTMEKTISLKNSF